MEIKAWDGFKKGAWTEEVNLRDFIQRNVTPYEGDDTFLAPATECTAKLWAQVCELINEENKVDVLDVETSKPSGITSHGAGYINRDLEKIVGLQTDKPLKRGIMPKGGIRVIKSALKSYGYELNPVVEEIYTHHRKAHNDGVFDAYTDDMRAARRSGIITGLPDAYGRGRIIGDYRRVALYGTEFLLRDKESQLRQEDLMRLSGKIIGLREEIQLREELSEQIRALKQLAEMAKTYGCDISQPAANVKEAIQWTYFAFLAAAKQQDGAATSLGRVASFLDIYAERDLKNGTATESEIQELMDHFAMKLRMIRFLRTPEYNALFSGDPTWVTEAIGGMCESGRTLVTKNSFRMIHTLTTLGPAPEPNLTILWSNNLPANFKKYCAKISIETSSLQYENDDLMRGYWGDDYAIACCVSAMRIGKQMQFFGARANLAKALTYAINGGKDEKSGIQIAPEFAPVTSEYLEFDEVYRKMGCILDWLAQLYISTLNIIHYMHDKYNYESLQMALHDMEVLRTHACGIAGLSVVVDSLSAIKYAKVKAIRDENGLAVDYEIEGDYPMFGNNDDRADKIANDLVKLFMEKLTKQRAYRNAVPTMSILTITSNVVYGNATGSTPDGRKAGEPFAPGANPMHGREKKGAIASMSSVAKLPYEYAQDGISYTFSVIPKALGREENERITNLSNMLDSFFFDGGHHININVFDKATLLDAMDKPEKYPQLTIRVSGYAVNFIKLTPEQQLEVIHRTFHESI
ncbi:MAG: formate C-acetyltransferase [Defluviitaleaceae bacterium]|nr:formate C-acetyltransferase [Defluviitaleaceae bacterium]MCL2263412.1 formate C-acetyltransferase [Defluviitaleaceae bacterium]